MSPSWRPLRVLLAAPLLALPDVRVTLLPPHQVRPYVRRNKTDRNDCDAILEAARCADIHPPSLTA